MNRVSIKKQINGGRTVAKNKTVIWIPYDAVDHEQFPARDANNVLIADSLVLLEGQEAIGIDCTAKDIARKDIAEGEQDSYGVIQEVTFKHPGNSLDVDELLQFHLGEEGYLITRGCVGNTQTRLHGTPCNPLILTYEEQDDQEGKFKMFTTRSVQKGEYKSAHYRGDLPTLAAYGTEGSGSSGGGI